MLPSERSRLLRQEADQVLASIDLWALLTPLGRPSPTGSYDLDLMMYPDIDINIPLAPPERLLSIAVELSKSDSVRRMVFLRGGPGDLSESFYLKPEIEFGDWGRRWKIDIWSMPERVLEAKHAEMLRLKDQMTPDQRETILEVKYQLLNHEGRTPMYSGIFIYRAVLDEGLRALPDIVEYLKQNGIAL